MDEVEDSTQAVPQYLPREITDIVISFLCTEYADEYDALCNCALVCRHWLPASRHYLLMHVRLQSDRQYNLFVSSVVRSPTMFSWLPSIRSIFLESLYHGGSYDNVKKSKQIASALFMHQLGGKFPNLETLSLFELFWGTSKSSIPPRMFILFNTFTSVRTLTLTDVRFPSSGTMRCTITALPSLIDLTMQQVAWPISRNILPPRSTRRSKFLTKVRRFQLGDLDSPLQEEILEWLPVTSFGTSLVNLEIRSSALRMELWEYAGPSVTRLVINFKFGMCFDGELAGDNFVGSLRHFTRLQSLRLNLYPWGKVFDPWEFVATFLLNSSPCSSVKDLSILCYRWDIRKSSGGDFDLDECELVVRNAETLDLVLDNSFEGLLTLGLELDICLVSEFYDKPVRTRIKLSQSGVEEAARKKLSRILEKAKLSVAASVRRVSKPPPSSPPEGADPATIRAASRFQIQWREDRPHGRTQ